MNKNLIPKKERDIIKQELNIEKWPLFAPSTCRNKSRSFTRIVTLENGNKITRKVTIGKVNKDELNILRIVDYKIYCALLKLWEDAGRPIDGYIKFTLHRIAECLNIAWSGKTFREIKESLTRLKGVPIVWEDSFYQKETDTMDTVTEYFTMLEHLKVFERKRHKEDQIYFAFSEFKLNSKIVSNLLNNYSKPVYLDVILKFKKEISILLYGYIDLVMADKEYFERKTKELFIDIGLTEYEYPSQRTRLLEPALKELEGAELTTGILSYLNLEKTVDGTDYKVIFRKSKKKVKLEDKTNKTQIIIQNIAAQKKLPDNKKTEIRDNNPLLSQLINLGVTEKVAKDLIKNYDNEFIEDRISDTIINKENIENMPAFIVKSIKDKWELSPKTKKKRKKVEEEEKKKLKTEYNNFLIDSVNKYLEGMNKKTIEKELENYRDEFINKYPEDLRESVRNCKITPQIEINYKLNKAKKLGLVTFEEWKSQR